MDMDMDKDMVKSSLKSTRDSKSNRDQTQARFERFWAQYPRKTAKQAAFKAFDKLDADAQERAISAVGWQSRSKDHLMREEQYTPHASTWLNQGRYDDPRPGRGGDGPSLSKIRI
jgi:hypothetical protein